jgi:methylmalonyl-CoA/ethylmalonyl-CoA epimerase
MIKMIKKIAHIGIAVENIEEQIVWYRDILGFSVVGYEDVPDQKVRVVILAVGEIHVELLQPTSPDSPIAKYLEKKGSGIHHIAYEVDDIKEAIAYFTEKKIQMIDKSPRSGAHDKQIAFVHPKSTCGVLTELCAHAR